MQGRSFLGLAQGKKTEWRDGLLYEYYWERSFPQTPTMHAIRSDRYKYIRYQGLWDVDELFDLQNDPLEMRNLIESPEHKSVALDMSKKLFSILDATGGLYIPLNADRNLNQSNKRNPDASKSAPFPASITTLPKTPAKHN